MIFGELTDFRKRVKCEPEKCPFLLTPLDSPCICHKELHLETSEFYSIINEFIFI